MKKLFLLSLGVLALVPVVAGTTVPTGSAAVTVAQAGEVTPELLQALKAQAGSTLSRPL